MFNVQSTYFFEIIIVFFRGPDNVLFYDLYKLLLFFRVPDNVICSFLENIYYVWNIRWYHKNMFISVNNAPFGF